MANSKPDLTILLNATKQGYVYALMDAAKYTNVLKELRENDLIFLNLFEDTPERDIEAKYCPLLVPLEPIHLQDENLISQWMEQNQEKHYLSFLQSALNAKDLQKVLRKRLYVKLPSGEEALFRYYDPKVLRHVPAFLNEEQLNDFLTNISEWWLQSGMQLKPISHITKKVHTSNAT